MVKRTEKKTKRTSRRRPIVEDDEASFDNVVEEDDSEIRNLEPSFDNVVEAGEQDEEEERRAQVAARTYRIPKRSRRGNDAGQIFLDNLYHSNQTSLGSASIRGLEGAVVEELGEIQEAAVPFSPVRREVHGATLVSPRRDNLVPVMMGAGGGAAPPPVMNITMQTLQANEKVFRLKTMLVQDWLNFRVWIRENRDKIVDWNPNQRKQCIDPDCLDSLDTAMYGRLPPGVESVHDIREDEIFCDQVLTALDGETRSAPGQPGVRTIRQWIDQNMFPWNGRDSNPYLEWGRGFHRAMNAGGVSKEDLTELQICEYMISQMKIQPELCYVRLATHMKDWITRWKHTHIQAEFKLKDFLGVMRIQMDAVRDATYVVQDYNALPSASPGGSNKGHAPHGSQGKKPAAVVSGSKGGGNSASQASTVCRCCGRIGHDHHNCLVNQAGHPDRNTDFSLEFAQSPKGIAWDRWFEDNRPQQPKAQRGLYWFKKLDGSKFDHPILSKAKQDQKDAKGASKSSEGPHKGGKKQAWHHKKKGNDDVMCGECVYPQVISEVCDGVFDPQRLVDVDDTVINSTIVLDTPSGGRDKMSVNILLDTGMVPAYAYVSHRVSQWARQHGAVVRKVNRRVCSSCLSDCVTSSVAIDEEIVLPFRIYNIMQDKFEVFIITCGIINTLRKDVIFGLSLIRENPSIRGILFHTLVQDEDLDTLNTLIKTFSTKKKEMMNKSLSIQEQIECMNARLEELELERKHERDYLAEQEKLDAVEQQAEDALLDTLPGLGRKKQREVVNQFRSQKDERRKRAREAAVTETLDAMHDTTDQHPDLPGTIEGDEGLKDAQTKLCMKYIDCFNRKLRREAALVPPMEVELNDDIRFDSRGNRLPPRIQGRIKDAEIDAQVTKMLEANVIRISTASAHSQVLLTPKPDGSWRFCVDYRRMNQCCKSISWPIPNITQMIQRLGKKKLRYFGVMDLTKGYFQTPLSERSKHLSAFITASGLYEYNRVPMGLMGAPAYFQRIMSTVVLAGLMYIKCEVYMDDVIVYGRTREEYLTNLEAVLDRLRKFRLTANPDKTRLGLSSIEYVGHTIDAEGHTFSRERLDRVIQFPKPNRKEELRSFLGMANYLRDHIKDHSRICIPLNNALHGPKKASLVWDVEREAAFTTLKERVNECPKLFFMDDTSPIHLYTDASNIGMGAYLCQERDGKEYPIGFMSFAFNDTQRRWHTVEQEAYAIVKALEKWEYLLRDVHFTLHTDHENLTYIRDTGSKKVMSWNVQISEYDFKVVHIAGVNNCVADALSRNPGAEMCQDRYPEPDRVGKDLESVNPGHQPDREPEDGEFFLMQSLNALREPFVIPDKEHNLISSAHSALTGHTGVEATMTKLQKAGHNFPMMRKYVEKFIKQCTTCQKNAHFRVKADVVPFTVGAFDLMERINVDSCGPFNDDKGNQHIIVIIDCFSRWVELYPSPDTSALSAARAICQWVSRFGAPSQILSDNGPQYHNEMIKQLCDMVGSQQILTMPYSKEENSMVERANREVTRFLRDVLLWKKDKANWSDYLPIAQRIMNSLDKEITGYAPCDLLYAGSIQLNKHLILPAKERVQEMSVPIEAWLKEKYDFQKKALEMAEQRQREHDAKHTSEKEVGKRTQYAIGDQVLKAYAPTSSGSNGRPSKLHHNFTGPYTVIKVHGNEMYDIRGARGRLLQNVSVHLIKPYEYDPARQDPQKEAMHDDESYFVEKVLSHKGSFTKKKQVKIEVKWVGFPEPTWEPWKNVMYSIPMHDYLRKRNLEKHIPKSIEET